MRTGTRRHGIAISADEQRLYVVNPGNHLVHVYDVNQSLADSPRLLANIKLYHAPPTDAWLSFSEDGQYLYVEGSGDVIDTSTLEIVDYLPPVLTTDASIEVDRASSI